jgi:hypothetical protein
LVESTKCEVPMAIEANKIPGPRAFKKILIFELLMCFLLVCLESQAIKKI